MAVLSLAVMTFGWPGRVSSEPLRRSVGDLETKKRSDHVAIKNNINKIVTISGSNDYLIAGTNIF